MKIHENKLRELIYSKYQKNFFDRINKPRKQTKISFEDLYDFPQILKKQTEEKINSLILNLEDMEFIGQEIQLKKEDASTTRIDLIAMTLEHGLAIIELKKPTRVVETPLGKKDIEEEHKEEIIDSKVELVETPVEVEEVDNGSCGTD